MSEPFPLASASARLRGKPGRPRLSDEEKARRAAKGAESRRARQQAQFDAVKPRLADYDGLSRYLGGLSTWVLRDLAHNKVIPIVRIPAASGRDVRRDFFDLNDADRLIESWKERA